jgi:hypothetical protein
MNRTVVPALVAFWVLTATCLTQKSVVSTAIARPIIVPAGNPLVHTREVETNSTALSFIPEKWKRIGRP